MGPGDHVLQQSAIGDGSRHWAFVAVMIEVEDLDLGHATVRRFEADDATERGRDADRAADVRTGRERCVPDASAAPDPPLEPPGEYAVFQGLRVTPHNF